MKLRLVALFGLSFVALVCTSACGDTVSTEPPAPDAGAPEVAVRPPPPPECTAGEDVDCTCANGTAGRATCDAKGHPGICGKCGETSLAQHTVISKSSKSAYEVETSLAAAPDGALASVWISVTNGGASDIGYTFSRDGGLMWTAPKQMGDVDGRESSDPVIVADKLGNFYATWIAFRRDGGGSASNFVLYIAKAAAGQNTFGTPVAADTFPTGDKPWITVTSAGTILVTVMEDLAGVATLVAVRSTDGGATWTKTTIFSAPNGDDANFVVPCASKTGARIWATNLSITGGSGLSQTLHWSDDDGVTWPAANTKKYGVNSAITPATCVAKGSDVWIAYGKWTMQPMDPEAPVDEYHVMHTSDGVTLNDVVASDTKPNQQNLGSFAMDDMTGEMALSYYAGDSDGAMGAVYSVRSNDGKNWSKATVISAPLTFTSDRSTRKWLGDYIGTVLRAGKLYATYGENVESFTHVGFSKTPP